MENLKLNLFKYKTLVYGEILEQNFGRGFKFLHKDCEMVSLGSPSLRGETLWLRGDNKKKDNAIFACDYEDEERAEKAYNTFLEMEKLINDLGDLDQADSEEEVIMNG